MRPIKILLIFTLVLFATTGFAAKKEKVDICHFDLDYGVWKQISISGNAVGKHFNNHDDGLPDGETLGTTTLLDDGCEPVPPPLLACPCWDNFTLPELAAAMNVDSPGNVPPICQALSGQAQAVVIPGDATTAFITSYDYTRPYCATRLLGDPFVQIFLDSPTAKGCISEIAAVIPHITWCSPD